MSLAMGWMLLALVGAAPGTKEPTHEALCGLKALLVSERSHCAERDRYELLPERIAELEGGLIPGEAARACLAEVRVGFQCVEAIAQRLGPPPAGQRSHPRFGRGSTPEPPLDTSCVRLEKDVRACPSS